MKKVLYTGLLAAAFMLTGFAANAETAKGQVVSTDNGTIVVQNGDTKMTMKTTDGTQYRKRKMVKKDKMKHGRSYKKGDVYYKPIVDEDDMVEVIYMIDPKTKEMIVEEIVICDD